MRFARASHSSALGAPPDWVAKRIFFNLFQSLASGAPASEPHRAYEGTRSLSAGSSAASGGDRAGAGRGRRSRVEAGVAREELRRQAAGAEQAVVEEAHPPPFTARAVAKIEDRLPPERVRRGLRRRERVTTDLSERVRRLEL